MKEIKDLYRLQAKDLPKFYKTADDAFEHYPKLAGAFADRERRLTAIKMVLRFYGAYDWKYGHLYSIDEDVNEILAIMPSENVDYSEERCEAADCEGKEYRMLRNQLTEDEQTRWDGLFDELDRLESELDIPKPHLYVDLVGVRQELQGQGRGSRIVDAACRFADEEGMPIMLFTNGERDVEFYRKHGFRILAVTRSEEYGFENTYMLYENK